MMISFYKMIVQYCCHICRTPDLKHVWHLLCNYYWKPESWSLVRDNKGRIMCNLGLFVCFIVPFDLVQGKMNHCAHVFLKLRFLNTWESLCNLIGSCPCLYHTIETRRVALLECFMRMPLALDWSIRTQGFIFILKGTALLLYIIFGQSLHSFV